MNAPITTLFTAILSVLMIMLAARVVLLRRRFRTGLGHGEHKMLERAVRVHGNAAENLPIALLLMLLYELSGGTAWALWLAGCTLFAGRLLHLSGVSHHSGHSFGRFWGTLITWCTILALAAADAVKALHAL